MKDVVSVVIPAYNNAGTIAATLRSVLAQTYRELEVIVSDHSSADDTVARVEPFLSDPRARLVTCPPGGGAARNWNHVTALATGTYLKLVCADDLIYPTCLEQQVAAMREHPGATLVSCRRDLIDASGALLVRGRGLGALRASVSGGTAVRTLVRAGSNLLGEPMCVLMRTEAVAAVGGWNPDRSYLIDEDLYVRVLRGGDLVALPETLAAFRVTAGQWSVRLARSQAAETRQLHRALRAESPDLVRRRDELVGAVRASRTALMRRVAYVVWRRRLQDPT